MDFPGRSQRARARRRPPPEPRLRHRPPEFRHERELHEPDDRPARPLAQLAEEAHAFALHVQERRSLSPAQDSRRRSRAAPSGKARRPPHQAHAGAGGLHRRSGRRSVQGGILQILIFIHLYEKAPEFSPEPFSMEWTMPLYFFTSSARALTYARIPSSSPSEGLKFARKPSPATL